VIEARNVIKKYGSVTALDDFSVEIPKGKIGILGPNGAGKSTFVKIALGLITANSGNVTVLGESLDKNSVNIRRRIGYMPEHDCIPNHMSGVEFLIEMGLVSGMDTPNATQRTHEILSHLQMGEEKYRKIEEYSGGMRQKIKLAQGLIHGPEIIFLDEPTSGLDPKARHEMLDTINGLTKVSNTNVLLSTHILQDVEMVCDYVIIINNGKLQMKENVKKLMKAQNDFIQIRVGGDVDGFSDILKSKKINLMSDGRILRVPYVNDNTFQQIIDAVIDSKCQLYEMERSKVTMDNIYLEVVE
jgi:ABC-2 type transport system ATP-binding protein|tara:strand:+ start:173 stop:1072 length:900 start_codon:yes stop_codon:yes gene_type:complete